MRKERIQYILAFVIMACTAQCRKAFNPPEIKASNHYLAIDGFINTGAGEVSTFTVTRSRNLSDTVPNIPELNAEVSILGSDGSSYPLTDTGAHGIYFSSSLHLDNNVSYQLSVTTSEGNKYLSDPVKPQVSPPIDSLNWELINDPVTHQQVVNIYANAHDPSNSTHYYRWDYLETYEHISPLETPWGESNGLIYPLGVLESTHYCWTTTHSNNILLGSSVALSEDVINHALLANFLQNDPKMDYGYSILVRQYPLTAEAYNYWLTVQKNSQSLGGLFDVQPSQVVGNIRGVTNTKDPVLGYVSASSVQERRLFISHGQLPGWKSNPSYSCTTYTLPTDPLNLLIYTYPDPNYGPYHFQGDLIISLIVAPRDCMDCRYQGGTNIKPSFWP
jgi:hypothetical protein